MLVNIETNDQSHAWTNSQSLWLLMYQKQKKDWCMNSLLVFVYIWWNCHRDQCIRTLHYGWNTKFANLPTSRLANSSIQNPVQFSLRVYRSKCFMQFQNALFKAWKAMRFLYMVLKFWCGGFVGRYYMSQSKCKNIVLWSLQRSVVSTPEIVASRLSGNDGQEQGLLCFVV